MGSCTAGGAYVPAMSDETVIVKGTGTIFLGGPPLVKAATGEEVTAEELGGADVACPRLRRRRPLRRRRRARARARARDRAPTSAAASPDPPWEPEAPERAAARPRRTLRDRPGGLRQGLRRARGDRPGRGRQPPARVQGALRTKRSSAASRHIEGFPVGILANNGVLFSESALKGAHFIELAPQASDPARLPPEHHRLHGRQGVRGRRHREGRRQDGRPRSRAPRCRSSR